MSLLLKTGISKLSELEIDADKDWNARGVGNILEVVLGMQVGDIAYKGPLVLERLAPGTANHVLTSQGAGHTPTWAPGGSYYVRYFPALITGSLLAEAAVIDDTINKHAFLASIHSETKTPTLSPSVLASLLATTVTPDQGVAKSGAPTSGYTWVRMDAVGGAIADDGAIQTDETAYANSSTTNDMTLLPELPEVGDAYYFGYSTTFPAIWLNQYRSGAGDWSIGWQYWDGGTWSGLAGVEDNGGGFRPGVSNIRYKIGFTIPGDWATCTVGGITDLYWVRAKVLTFSSISAQPKGTQAWIQTASG